MKTAGNINILQAMRKIILLLFFLLPFCCLYPDDLRISMGNSSGNGQNVYVRIEDKGTAEGGARYDKETRSIVNTSDGTCISIGNVDFGSGRYGLYSHILIEYSCDNLVSTGFFDIYLGNTTTPIASVPVEKTNPGAVREGYSTMNVNVVGTHRLYIRWRGHAASIKTVGGRELKPFAEVKAVRTGSPLNYQYSFTGIEKIEGVHRLKMLWKNQNANVYAVYLSKSENTSIRNPGNEPEAGYKIYSHGSTVYVESETSLEKVTVYSVTGKEIYKASVEECILSVSLPEGIYLIRIDKGPEGVYVKKIIVRY